MIKEVIPVTVLRIFSTIVSGLTQSTVIYLCVTRMSSTFAPISLDVRINAKVRAVQSCVCTRHIVRSDRGCYFRSVVFFRYDKYGFEIIEQRKTGHSARYVIEQLMINAKAPNRTISAACFFDKRKTRTRKHEHTHPYSSICIHMTHTHTCTHTGTCLYTTYKMNARRHTLDGNRTKLATGIL